MTDEMSSRMGKIPGGPDEQQSDDACSRCGSERIMRNVRIVDRGHGNARQDLRAEVYEDPYAFIFKGAHEAKLLANICADCGRVEVFVTNPQELWEVYQSLPPDLRPQA